MPRRPPLTDAARQLAAANALRRALAAVRRAERLLTAGGYDLPWADGVRLVGDELERVADGCERYARHGGCRCSPT